MNSQTLDSNSYIRKSESSKTRIIVTNGTWSWSLGSRSRFENCPHLYQNKFEFKIKKNYGVPTSWTPSDKSEDCKNDYLQSTTQLKEVFNLDWVAMCVTSHIRNLKNGLEHQNYMSIVQKVLHLLLVSIHIRFKGTRRNIHKMQISLMSSHQRLKWLIHWFDRLMFNQHPI